MTLALVLLAGVLMAGGLVSLVAAVVPATPRLTHALARVSADADTARSSIDVGQPTSRSERLGAAVYRSMPVPLTDTQRRALLLQDKSIAEFYADKVVMGLIGAIVPAVAGFLFWMATGTPSGLPAIGSLFGLVVGFFVPDLLVRRSAGGAKAGATSALLVFIDLVTLERLANASSSQALHNAAMLSDVTLFRQIRLALERARLEQQSPYAQLRRLADQIDLPELRDVADIMHLDESGAALSDALRARLRELRDAHLTREQLAASAAAEGMTIYMALPVMIFALVFFGAAFLRLVSS